MASDWTTAVHPLDVSEMLRVLDGHGVRHVLVGGVAAIFHGCSGATFDADIVPDLDQANLTALAAALRDLRAQLYADARRQDLDARGAPPEAADLDLGRPDTLRRRSAWFFSTRAGRLDVMPVIDGPGGYTSLAPRAVTTQVGGARLLVISLADLVESKETAGRPKDLAALGELWRLLDERSQGPASP